MRTAVVVFDVRTVATVRLALDMGVANIVQAPTGSGSCLPPLRQMQVEHCFAATACLSVVGYFRAELAAVRYPLFSRW